MRAHTHTLNALKVIPPISIEIKTDIDSAIVPLNRASVSQFYFFYICDEVCYVTIKHITHCAHIYFISINVQQASINANKFN